MRDEQYVRAELLSSLILFTRFFYKLRTGREFFVSQPICREPHPVSISRELMRSFKGQVQRLIINCPPRYGKTELVAHYVAWTLAHYPNCNFIYVSYSHTLAARQTHLIKQIITLPEFQDQFACRIAKDSSAKDDFQTIQGGSVYAAGAGGTVTGMGAGIQGITRFGGSVIIDDIHKPDEVLSDTIRTNVNGWYLNTLRSRVNNPLTPIVFIGQRLHEDDLASNLLKGYDGAMWDRLCLPALDGAGNALYPEMHDKNALLIMKDKMPYDFASQYQQEPQPAGGGIYKPEWFVMLEDEPEMLATFITADTAETDKTYNDATVFSFWGIYKIKQGDVETDLIGLHWIDCEECWIEPKDLKDRFLGFYMSTMRYPKKPLLAAIERKSTGTTLISVLKDVRGLTVLEIERSAASGSKATRFLATQPYASDKLISLPTYGKHTQKVMEHMKKITANDSHRYDDICDTFADAVRLAFIEKTIPNMTMSAPKKENIIKSLDSDFRRQLTLRQSIYGNVRQ